MPRKAEEPLARKKISLFEGDFEKLGDILQAKGVTPSVFIRHLVRRKLRQLESVLNDVSQPTEEIEINDLIAASRLDTASNESTG